MQVYQLRCLAPRRNAVQTPNGKWYTIPWTPEAKVAYEAAGGKFGTSGAHDFTK